jgi:hypothetical protein
MCKKFYFTLRGALLLANASLASKEPAGAKEGPGMVAYHSTPYAWADRGGNENA